MPSRLSTTAAAALALALAAAAGGCAAADPARVREALARGRIEIAERPDPPLGARICWWVPNRLLDVADLAAVELHAGPGAGGRFAVTRALAYGYSAAEHAVALGFHGREAGVHAVSLSGESVIGWRHKADLGLRRRPFAGPIVPVDLGGPSGVDPDPVRDGLLDVEVAGHVLVVGFLVKVRAGELPDLLAGLAALDLEGDDLPRPVRVAPAAGPGAAADIRRWPAPLGPELAALLRSVPAAATATARALYADASGDAVVRLGVALVGRDGRRIGSPIAVVRAGGALAILDERTRLSRPWLR